MDDKTTMTKSRIAITICIWLMILGVGVGVYKFWWAPRQEAAEEARIQDEKQKTIQKTSATARYKHSINAAFDSFSGYAPFRSNTFREETGRYGLRAEFRNDNANYTQRLDQLANGNLDVAVFTLDALIKASAIRGEMPATVIDIIDETKGADAAVGSKKRFPNIDALNIPDLKIVCTPDSPSEFLGRLIISQFNLDRLPPNPFQFVDGPEAVYEAYRKSGPNDNKIFILWEPFVSKVVDNPDFHVLIDSSKFRGYIVDVLVARREFAVKNENILEYTVKAWRSSLYQHRNDMSQLVTEDSKLFGTPLKKEQADKLIDKIWWKNTQESYGHFGLVSSQGLQHIEEMCINITEVLIKTKAIERDPTDGQPNMWYYDGVVRKLYDSSWHPGFGPESVRQEQALASLTDEEWVKLKPVGTLQVPRLVFARGGARLSESSQQTLDSLATSLQSWPQYYLIVRGNHASDGDTEANRILAETRAQSAVDYLIGKGVDRIRIHAETSKPNGSTTVSFVLGELPY